MAAAASVEQVAKALNITVRRANQLVHEGMPRAERGKYDLGACMLWYIRFLQNALSKKATMGEDGEISSLQGSRQELYKVQTERERFNLEKDRGLVIPTELHEKILADLIVETNSRVRAVGARIAGDLIGETSRIMIQAKLEKAHDEALRTLAKVVPRVPTDYKTEQNVNEAKEEAKPRKARAKKRAV